MGFDSQYSDAVTTGMQMLYGEGFLSPGGAGEVTEMLDGSTLTGKTVLDLGCGIGGGSIMLVQEFDAKYVTGIDVEQGLIDHAVAAVREADLEARITMRHVAPGPFPFDGESFDVVFTKDVACHIENKDALFAEIFRVLKPGGQLICADFLDGDAGDDEAAALYDSYVKQIGQYGLFFHFENLAAYRDAMTRAGFQETDFRDHTDASIKVCRRELAFVESPDAGKVRELLGADFFQVRAKTTAKRLKALIGRGFQHYHMHAKHPN